MNPMDIMKALMKKKGITHKQMAKKLKMATISGVSNRLNGNTITLDALLRMLHAMDCELVIRDTIGDKDVFVVTNAWREETCQDTATEE